MDNLQKEYEKHMRKAIAQAHAAGRKGEVPIGAVVVRGGEVIARAHNLRETNDDPTAHAEVLALRRAGKKLGRWNLFDCDLYVTLEPCAMCSGAVVYSRVRKVVFGAYDLRFGCSGTLMNLSADERLNHRAEVTGGILRDECAALLQDFFRDKRANPRQKDWQDDKKDT